MKKQKLLFILLLFLGNVILYAQCSINAGGNATICGTSYTLQGSSSGSTNGTPVWTLVSKPSGAPDPVISNINSLTPNVTGMTYPGNYVFQVAQSCNPSGTVTSQVTITASGDASTFTAGPDITGIPATTGVAALNATIPAGYTASWTYYNIFSFESNGTIATTNATMSNTTTASPTLTLTNKTDHTTDPAYRAVLRITSVNNPNCWYEDDAIVRFLPNPNMTFPATSSQCVTPGTSGASFYYDANSTSPKFSTSTTNSSGNSSFGTTVTMTVVSQPAGGNIQYSRIENGRLYFSGITTTGAYTFDLTISNTLGSYTKRLTYNFNGTQPGFLDFIDPAYSNQMEIFSNVGSAGSLYCNMVGSTAPITFYFQINSADPPTTITSVAPSGVIPSGGTLSIVETGAGTMNRSVTLTPPSGGWRAGTYRFNINVVGAGGCSRTPYYYVHISDNTRPAVNVDNITVCYPGSGVVSATVPLPTRYQTTTANPSYFQDFAGRYDFTLVSGPAGAAAPTYEATTARSFTSASTQINNLNKPGEYVFRIKAAGSSGSQGFINAEYLCAGTSSEDTFSIFVSAQVGSNAGSAQTLVGTTQTTFNGNNPGVATGAWTLLSKPAGATDPVIVTPSAYNTNVTGFNTPGVYTFRWTVTTGTCISTSDLTVNVVAPSPGGIAAAVWYKADAGVYSDAGTTAAADNTAVQQWNDQMGTGRNLLQTTAAQKPAFSNQSTLANFNPTVTFNADFMAADPGSGNEIITRTQGSIYIAGKMNTVGASKTSFAGFDQTMNYPGLSTSNTNPSDKLMFYSGGTYNSISTNLFVTQKPFVAGSSWLNGGGTPNTNVLAKVWLDGNENIYNNTSSNVNTGNGLRIFRVGGDTDWGSLDGQLNETIVFANPLSASEKARVDSYLSVKWGSTLTGDYVSSDNTVVWTTSPIYQNNILGIARDNISVLYQKQSRSENIGQKLIIGAGSSLANTNAANTNTLTDRQFLLAGDNGLEQKLKIPLSYTTGSNGVANTRFESIWKVQNTNSVGTVTVAWPKDVSNLYLVQSTDAVFDGTDTFTPMVTEVTVNGVVYNTTNVTLANGQYFTFAGFVPNYCVNGCNPNNFVNSSDPNTIEYDNIVSIFHSTIVKEGDGSFKTWGAMAAPNGTSHLLVPTPITSANGFNYTGTPLKATGGMNVVAGLPEQHALLTTDGLYVWGAANILISSSIKSTTAFGKITVNGKADGLPAGVMPTDVKMMFGSYGTLAIVTCSGEAWVLSMNGAKNGDGTAQNAVNNVIWHRVKTSAIDNLNNVVAMRGTTNALFALTSEGKLYTWGTGTY
ncbi:hypothetical protein [Chryseobacterium sp. 2987]|uniref:hypothetical protein n=1 Tax=Chryseobacterium sp. 2987 TaxID=2817767 RepID=UPI00285F6B4A|nr:hypothetical protein [Chryseobacterium sp. 2987]MDR6919569.1 hypothetical protein [Chryseobacterium sp. 2987]